MTDPISIIQTLRRPRLLLEAARHGVSDYNRSNTLRRLTKSSTLPDPFGAMRALIPVEESLEHMRKEGDATYVPSRHVEVLIAILGEMRIVSKRWQITG